MATAASSKSWSLDDSAAWLPSARREVAIQGQNDSAGHRRCIHDFGLIRLSILEAMKVDLRLFGPEMCLDLPANARREMVEHPTRPRSKLTRRDHDGPVQLGLGED
jgi:hypothetical protein